MRQYETTFILRPNLGEDQFTEIIERTSGIITGDGGTVIDTDRWGIKRLAYEIKKEVQGYYVCMNYAAPGRTIEEIERIFRIDDRLLRFLTIKLADAIDAAGITKEQENFAARATAETETDETDSREEKTETAAEAKPTEAVPEPATEEETVNEEKAADKEEPAEEEKTAAE